MKWMVNSMKGSDVVPYDSIPHLLTGSFLTKEQAEQFMDTFKNLTVVVRCKDCRFGEQTKNMRGEQRYACNNRFTGIFQDFVHEPDWFCASGERRTDE